jgi:MEMO1 family protein
MSVRKPAVAGYFYPLDPRLLEQQLNGLLAQAPPPVEPPPKAIIAPHAGYVYSGPIAASAYARVALMRDRIKRVVLLGPAHRIGFRGLAAPSVDDFETPLGWVAIDQPALAQLQGLPQVIMLDAAHAHEHSLEVHLPFLQRVVGDVAIVPLVVGEASAAEVADVLNVLWGGPETLIVVSSDLSHYQDYTTAQRLDQATARAIETLRYEDLGYDDACGRVPVSGLLYQARRRGLTGRTVDLRNSGDVAGDRKRVVGYGAFVFH